MDYIKKIEDLRKKGFLIEVITDGWANWKFDGDGNPIHETASPGIKFPSTFGYRGIYKYFDKNGKLQSDDTGMYIGIKEMLDVAFEKYDNLKDLIDKNGFLEEGNISQ